VAGGWAGREHSRASSGSCSVSGTQLQRAELKCTACLAPCVKACMPFAPGDALPSAPLGPQWNTRPATWCARRALPADGRLTVSDAHALLRTLGSNRLPPVFSALPASLLCVSAHHLPMLASSLRQDDCWYSVRKAHGELGRHRAGRSPKDEHHLVSWSFLLPHRNRGRG